MIASVPIPLGAEGARGIRRADIEIGGLEHAGASYELRIFLNNSAADADTPPTPGNGYAGSIFVYGYGGPRSPGDARLPLTRSLPITDAVRAAAARGTQMSVTLVPVDGDAPDLDLDALEISVLVDGDASGPG